MGKYLFLLAGVLVVYWIVRAGLRRRAHEKTSNNQTAENMVRCAECGVHLPRGESLMVRDQYYCCAEHQRRHHAGG